MSRVIDGADSTLDMIEKVPCNAKNRPLTEVKLYNVSHAALDSQYTST